MSEDLHIEPNGARQAISAGGVVFRHGEHGVEVVLVGRSRDGLWALPKGTPDPGESIEETALREVREETGLEVEIVEPIGEVRYCFYNAAGARVDKVVYHFLMRPVGGDFAAHDHEHDLIGWYHVAEAGRLLTHKNQLHILDRAFDRIANMSA